MTDDGIPDFGGLAQDAQADQARASLASVAKMMGWYHAALLAGGVPATTAPVLLRDYHWLFWHSTVLPGRPLRVMPGE